MYGYGYMGPRITEMIALMVAWRQQQAILKMNNVFTQISTK